MRGATFYAEKLDFEIGTLWPSDTPEFAILSRNGVRLQLTHAADVRDRSNCTLWLDVTEIDRKHARLKYEIDIEWGPEIYSYGRKEFAFRDPDHHLIILSEGTNEPPTCLDP